MSPYRPTYVRRGAPVEPRQTYRPPSGWPRPVVLLLWAVSLLALATVVVLFAGAIAGRTDRAPGATFVTATTYGAPTCHEDNPCGVTR